VSGDPLAFRRVGPGVTFVSLEGLALRLTALDIGDIELTKGLMAALGVGFVQTPSGETLYHWETVLVKLMRAMAQQRCVRLKDGTAKETAATVRFSGDRWFCPEDQERGALPTVFLCLAIDRAYDGRLPNEELAERVMETRRTLDDLERALEGYEFGLEGVRTDAPE
jgi:hypothetical protein